MKHFIKIFSLIISIVLLATMCSCSLFAYDNSRFDGGDTLDEELLSKIENDLNSELQTSESQAQAQESQTNESQTSELPTSEPQTTESGNEGNKASGATVYWTSSGSVWHTRRDCSYIKKSQKVLSGTVEEAIADGKKKLCSSCEKH